jgi:hypothetical protein
VDKSALSVLLRFLSIASVKNWELASQAESKLVAYKTVKFQLIAEVQVNVTQNVEVRQYITVIVIMMIITIVYEVIGIKRLMQVCGRQLSI